MAQVPAVAPGVNAFPTPAEAVAHKEKKNQHKKGEIQTRPGTPCPTPKQEAVATKTDNVASSPSALVEPRTESPSPITEKKVEAIKVSIEADPAAISQYREEVKRQHLALHTLINKLRQLWPASGLSVELNSNLQALELQDQLLQKAVSQELRQTKTEDARVYRVVNAPAEVTFLKEYIEEAASLKRKIKDQIDVHSSTRTPSCSAVKKDVEDFQKDFSELDKKVMTLKVPLETFLNQLRIDIKDQNELALPAIYLPRAAKEQDLTVEEYNKKWTKPYDDTFSKRCDLYAEVAIKWNNLIPLLFEISYLGECLAVGMAADNKGIPSQPGRMARVTGWYYGGDHFKSEFEGVDKEGNKRFIAFSTKAIY